MFTDNGNDYWRKAMTIAHMTQGSCELKRSKKYTVSTNK
jgi:hypothetical protein